MARLSQPSLFDAVADAEDAAHPRTFADFFAGIGLARLGFERAGWRVRYANDLDPVKRRMYEDHFGAAPHYSTDDVHDVAKSPEAVPTVALAHASFPCTDLSVAGARRGLASGQSSAFWGFRDVLKAMGERRPRLVLLENVLGFLTSHDGSDFRAALIAMNELGYAVDVLTIDAAHFVPQSRPRLFVICKRDHDEEAISDLESLAPSSYRSPALVDRMRSLADIDWSVCELPELPAYGDTKLPEVIERVPNDSPEWWNDDRAAYLLSQMSEKHRTTADAMMKKRRWSFGTVFRRIRDGKSMAELRTDGLAGCLRTPKGGSGRQILFQAGYGRYRVRLLNPTECARLMGADGFRVTGSVNQALFGFGDAVCADAIEWIATSYLNRLVETRDTMNASFPRTRESSGAEPRRIPT